jgi:regulation of enolase protein 1 (concanavalin A-like superfamily)
MKWLNEPSAWKFENGVLLLRTDPKTDFWRKTHYGFVRDSGHFFFEPVSGDFEATITVRGAYRELYDQAGLMVRADPTTWLKTGIEFVEGVQYASAVVTRDYSDWSVVPLAVEPSQLKLRVKRTGGAIVIEYAVGEAEFKMLRTAFLSEAPELQVGPMAATPEGSGFDVRFTDWELNAQ